jgi:hypothetical protein
MLLRSSSYGPLLLHLLRRLLQNHSKILQPSLDSRFGLWMSLCSSSNSSKWMHCSSNARQHRARR